MVLEKRVTTFIIAREKPFAENGTNGTEEQPLIESACTRCNKFTNEISRHKDDFFFCPVFHLHLCKTARQVIFVGHSRPLALLLPTIESPNIFLGATPVDIPTLPKAGLQQSERKRGDAQNILHTSVREILIKKSTYLTHEWFGQSSWIQELTMNAVLLCCTANNPDFPTPNSLCLLTKGS